MALMADSSAIKVDATIEEKIRNASSEEIKEIFHQAAVDQGLVTRDYYSPDVLLPVEGATAQRYAKAVVVDGVKHIIEADSELALEKSVGEFLRAQLTQQTQQTQQTRDNATGRFVEQGKQDEAAAVTA